jgi:hypothetical protein
VDPAALSATVEAKWTASVDSAGTWAPQEGRQSYSPDSGEYSAFIPSPTANLESGRSDALLAFGSVGSNLDFKHTEAENLRYEADVNTVTWLPSGRPTAVPEPKDCAAFLGSMAAIGALLARRKQRELSQI